MTISNNNNKLTWQMVKHKGHTFIPVFPGTRQVLPMGQVDLVERVASGGLGKGQPT